MASIVALKRHLEPLKEFLKMDGVTEICINEPCQVFVEKNSLFENFHMEKLDVEFLETLARLVAEYNNKDFPSPLISGSLPSGERVQFVTNPACENNKIVCCIRRPQMRNLSLDDYMQAGAFDEVISEKADIHTETNKKLIELYNKRDILNFMKLAIISKKNIVISGGTGTGKTTLLNACLKMVPENERLITVEDTREVKCEHRNRVHLLFNEDDERITAQKVFKVCLRLRPDRIFLSELRQSEAWPFLRAANSGHPGSLSTVHADTPDACFEQIAFMMQQSGSTASNETLKKYIKSIINIVIQVKRCSSEGRFMYVPELYFDVLHKE